MTMSITFFIFLYCAIASQNKQLVPSLAVWSTLNALNTYMLLCVFEMIIRVMQCSQVSPRAFPEKWYPFGPPFELFVPYLKL